MVGGEVSSEVRNQKHRASISTSSSLRETNSLDEIPTEAPVYGTGKTIDLHLENDYRQGGLRRKPSNAVNSPAQTEFPRPDIGAQSSWRRQRSNSEVNRDETHRFSHLDSRERSRLSCSQQNIQGWMQNPGSSSRPHPVNVVDDVEPGVNQWAQRNMRHSSSGESSDDYFYERQRKKEYRHASPDERFMMRKSMADWMDSSLKNHFVATIGEFVGTTMFLFFGFAGAQVANIGVIAEKAENGDQISSPFDISVYLYISMIFGFSLLVNVWIFYRISGAHFNPAVTLSLVLVGAVPILRAICLFFAQILGSIAASALVLGLFPTPLNVRTSLGPGTSKVQGVFIEAFLTAELVFTILMLAKEKHRATFIAPIGIGLALFIASLVGIHYTGSSLNPARSFGPCVVTATFEEEHWIYWVGPFIGALMAVVFYKFLKVLEYEMTNPGQDGDDENDPTKNKARLKELMRQREERFG